MRLQAPVANGVKVTKVYRFHRASYLIDVAFEIANEAERRYSPTRTTSSCATTSRRQAIRRCCRHSRASGVYTDKEKFQKIAFSDIEKNKAVLPKDVSDGWIAICSTTSSRAWLPKNGTPREFYVRRVDNLNAAGVIVPGGRRRARAARPW